MQEICLLCVDLRSLNDEQGTLSRETVFVTVHPAFIGREQSADLFSRLCLRKGLVRSAFQVD